MDAAVLLALAVLVQAIIIACLAASIPFLWWQLSEVKRDLAAADDLLVRLCKAANLDK